VHVLAVSAITDPEAYDDALKLAHAALPGGARWVLAVASTDGTRVVNVVAHDSVEAVRDHLEAHLGAFATTEYREADAANAVGLAAE
jgi:hypothetical protein